MNFKVVHTKAGAFTFFICNKTMAVITCYITQQYVYLDLKQLV